jgi:nitric-oxide synthase
MQHGSDQVGGGCPHAGAPVRRPADDPPRDGDRVAEAEDFLITFYRERRPGEDPWPHIAEVRADLERTGTYHHTSAELQFGAELAWRHSVRCVGRSRWRSIRVRDRRHVCTAQEIADELHQHLHDAMSEGNIRSVITIFAADDPQAGPHALIWNDQLIRYAGYVQPDGSILGDPQQVLLTATAIGIGWQPPEHRTRFDILPWIIETSVDKPTLFPVPAAAVVEVPIRHPDHPWLADLGLRWHALPVISNMRLRIGGVDYSCAPFSGFYLSDEIATRNFGDEDRYNQLPAVAAGLGLDRHSRHSMWREHAALVLNQAVLYSFREAGISIADGYNESVRFARFVAREEAAGRVVHADWSWINGHFGHSLGPAFHRYYDECAPPTNFWRDPDRLDGPSLVDRHVAAGNGGRL